MSPSSPIVVIDSGLGGLTVARALRSRLPHEQVVYFGDTARLPYGAKSAATVTTFVEQIIAYLRRYDPKHVLLACNTATALALPSVRAAFPDLPVSGVVDPGAKAAVIAAGAKEYPVIGVIATEATVRSRAYARAVGRLRHHAKLLMQPTPLLVPMIEEGRGEDDPLVRLALKQYLAPLARRKVEVLVLGCTHYPVYEGLIGRMLGDGVRVIDSAEQCADDVARRLQAAGMLAAPAAADGPELRDDGPFAPTPEGSAASPADAAPDAPAAGLRCFVTDDPARFARLAPRFLGRTVAEPTWVAPEELYGAPLPAPALDVAPVRRAAV